MTRDEAAEVARDVMKGKWGWVAKLARLPQGAPDGPVWVVQVRSLVTKDKGFLRSREAWERFLEERRTTKMTTTMEPVERERRVQAGAGVALLPEPPLPSADEVREILNDGKGALLVRDEAAPVTFERWRQLTEAGIRETEQAEQRLRDKLAGLDEEVARKKARLRAEIAQQRQREARTLRRALGLAPPSPGGDGQAERPPAARAPRTPQQQQRAAGEPTPGVARLMARVREYARGQPDGFRVSELERALGITGGAMQSEALKRLVAAGELEKPHTGFYRPIAQRVAAQEEA
jgi:hypothetical protein